MKSSLASLGLIVLAMLGSGQTAPTSPTRTARSPKVAYAGVNIAGFDFGCLIDGACTITAADAENPTPSDIVNNGDAIPQMNHFVSDLHMNVFRLPVGWQYLTNNQLGGELDWNNFGTYNKLVQGCLASGAEVCIVDVHNYARWYGGVIGQSGVTDENFVSLWAQLADQYKNNQRVWFGLMNEPHDLDVNRWGQTVQAAVSVIRHAGATQNTILLPGTDFASAGSFVSSGSGDALLKITNLDGSTSNLILDVHKYLDYDGSGTHTECTTNNIDDTFQPLANWLRAKGRQAFLSETGGGNTDSCYQDLCAQLDWMNYNADVYLGYTAWAAGGFWSGYELTEVPVRVADGWQDMPIVTNCVAGKFNSP